MKWLKDIFKIAAPMIGAHFLGPAFGGSMWAAIGGASVGSALGSLMAGDNRRNILRSSLFAAAGTYAGYKLGGGGMGFLPKPVISALPMIGAGLGGAAHWHLQRREARMWSDYARAQENYGGRGHVSESASRHMANVASRSNQRVQAIIESMAPQVFNPTRETMEQNKSRGEPVGRDRNRGLVVRDAVERNIEDKSISGGYWSGPPPKEWSRKYGAHSKKNSPIRTQDIRPEHYSRLRKYGYT
jgi:hypothetical protein